MIGNAIKIHVVARQAGQVGAHSAQLAVQESSKIVKSVEGFAQVSSAMVYPLLYNYTSPPDLRGKTR
jgi:hypothetical protein